MTACAMAFDNPDRADSDLQSAAWECRSELAELPRKESKS